ncbi:IS66 family insertion sequence hypothetical protein [Photobacterium frigidiphilum]|uniref:IS66 family insertion sequence element accessory protein TnpB n=2 Tax=Photobacterium frigidiphilum TaxID=264736 RepID=A0A2T3JAH2_9GAMM|nr:IS66 family insertion sequence hypothetical protein [Photobacterium frigidiphilum]
MPKGKKRTPEQWLALFEEHQSSGLSAAEFCRRNDIHPKTFSAHKAPWNKENKASTFVKVEAQTPRQRPSTESALSPIQLSIGQLQLTLPANTEPHWLGLLLKGYQS